MKENANHSVEYRVMTLCIGLLASLSAACASTVSSEESARSKQSARWLEIVDTGQRCFQMRSVAGEEAHVGDHEVAVCPFVNTSPMLRDHEPENGESVARPKAATDCLEDTAAVN